ncbi:MAG: KH domain-containing protein [Bacilli bacterium]
MNYIELTKFLVSSVIENKESLTIREIENEDDLISLFVFVDSSDLGAVIGKSGKTANSIRTLVKASMYKNYKHIRIEFQSYED